MNIINAQKEVFAAMISGCRCGKYEFDESRVFITPDGYHGFVIPYSTVQVNLAKIRDMKNLDLQTIVREENRGKLTKEALVMERPRRVARKLKNGDKETYFDEKLMRNFQNPKFYFENNTGLIVVTEDISTTRIDEIVGVILPVRTNPRDFD